MTFLSLLSDILCRIVSQLPIKEAVRTSILSTQWRYFWCCHTNLAFSFRSMLSWHFIKRPYTPHRDKQTKQEFIERVNMVLQQHCGAGVEKIEVRFPFENELMDLAEKWLNFALASKTKQLIFDSPSASHAGAKCNLNFQLFDGSSSSHLQSVKLSSFSLKLPVDFKGFLNLKRLYLADMSITDEDLKLLMSNCNALEFLGLVYCGMLTSLRISHPSNRLKHLHVDDCRLLQAIEVNFGLVTLDYRGPLIPLVLPGASLLTNICMKLLDVRCALEYIFTKLPSTLPRLETLVLRCSEQEVWDTHTRVTLPENLPTFVYLRHLRLELTFGDLRGKTDVLDFACLLQAAPFLEKLEFHMWMSRDHLRYSKGHGELRSLPSHPHPHLKVVYITGFYGQKDQLELALHILRNSVRLESMKVDPKPVIAADYGAMEDHERFSFLDGYEVALEFLCKEDRRNVVAVTEVLRSIVESTPTFHLIDPFWINFLAEKKA